MADVVGFEDARFRLRRLTANEAVAVAANARSILGEAADVEAMATDRGEWFVAAEIQGVFGETFLNVFRDVSGKWICVDARGRYAGSADEVTQLLHKAANELPHVMPDVQAAAGAPAETTAVETLASGPGRARRRAWAAALSLRGLDRVAAAVMALVLAHELAPFAPDGDTPPAGDVQGDAAGEAAPLQPVSVPPVAAAGNDPAREDTASAEPGSDPARGAELVPLPAALTADLVTAASTQPSSGAGAGGREALGGGARPWTGTEDAAWDVVAHEFPFALGPGRSDATEPAPPLAGLEQPNAAPAAPWDASPREFVFEVRSPPRADDRETAAARARERLEERNAPAPHDTPDAEAPPPRQIVDLPRDRFDFGHANGDGGDGDGGAGDTPLAERLVLSALSERLAGADGARLGEGALRADLTIGQGPFAERLAGEGLDGAALRVTVTGPAAVLDLHLDGDAGGLIRHAAGEEGLFA
jgi:hypothetical protein